MDVRQNVPGYLFSIGGFSIRVEFDPPVPNFTIASKLKKFQVGEDEQAQIVLRHHAPLPSIDKDSFGDRRYNASPWIICQDQTDWLYFGVVDHPSPGTIYLTARFNQEHTQADIFHENIEARLEHSLTSLTLFPTDQILLARLLADQQGCIFHAAGMTIDGQGFLFVGHSSAGKSTLVTLLQDHGEILCDDRIILRRWPEGFRIYGTWSHGDIPVVSPNSAPLRAICLLEQAPHNLLIPIDDRREIVRRLPFFIIRPLVTRDWWEKTLDLVGQIACEVPVYRLQFEKSKRVLDVLRSLL